MATPKIYHELAARAFPEGYPRHYKRINNNNKPPPKKTFPLIPKIINGGIAGIAGIASVYPLDLVKVRLQNQTIGPNGEKQYKNMFDCFKKTVQREGFFGMYRGALLNIIYVTPEKGVKFAANDFFRFHLARPDGSLSYASQGVAGAMAGVFQCMITTPMELVKIQIQDAGRIAAQASKESTKVKHVGAIALIIKMLRERGPLGLYKGVAPTALRDISHAAIYFPMVQMIDDRGPVKTGGKQPFWWTMLAGFMSGGVSSVLANPFDVMKTRMQTLTKGKGERHYTSLMDCFTHTLKHDGPKAFLKGSMCRVIVLGPLYGITQAVYFYAVGEQIIEKLGYA